MAKKLPKKAGRPPLMRDARMRALRIGDDDWLSWQAAASEDAIGVSEWIRRVCNAAAMRPVPKSRRK